MRLLASLADEDQATRLADYLLTIGIDNSLEEGSSGWSIWVKDDDKVEQAKQELAQFQSNPNDARYAAAPKTAAKVRAEQEKRAQRLGKNYIDVRTQWSGLKGGSVIVTLSLIVLSCIVFGLEYTRFERDVFESLWIAGHGIRPAVLHIGPLALIYYPISELTELRHGQIWRLITPIFIHYGIWHIIFNMFWTRDLGSMIERKKGALRLALMVLLIAILSNLGQYIVAAPGADGMPAGVSGRLPYV